MADIEDTLVDVAEAPRKASGDMGSVENHSIPDLIKLADRAAAADAFDSEGRPRMHVSRMKSPGAV